MHTHKMFVVHSHIDVFESNYFQVNDPSISFYIAFEAIHTIDALASFHLILSLVSIICTCYFLLNRDAILTPFVENPEARLCVEFTHAADSLLSEYMARMRSQLAEWIDRVNVLGADQVC